MKPKLRNVWFRLVLRGNRKSCSYCHKKLPAGESIWCWGYYHNAKWRSIRDFCIWCWPDVAQRITRECHAEGREPCFQFRGDKQPEWMVDLFVNLPLDNEDLCAMIEANTPHPILADWLEEHAYTKQARILRMACARTPKPKFWNLVLIRSMRNFRIKRGTVLHQDQIRTISDVKKPLVIRA